VVQPLCKMFSFSAISSFNGKILGNWTFRNDAIGDKGTLNLPITICTNHTHCQQKILKLMTLSCIQTE
jgi:hypothetical protein